jgi:hypothetical protein
MDFDEQEPLIEGLRELPREMFDLPNVSDDLRRAVLQRTTARVRVRPRRLRLAGMCAVALAYVAGLGTAALWPRTPAQAPTQVATAVSQEPAAASVSTPDIASNVISPTRLDPQELLARVPDAPREEQIRLLRQAGDLYLSQWNDVERALYCYRQVLELASSSGGVTVDPGDTWLLASLKLARIQETTHENPSS